jgi:hypothetical protein
LGERLLCKQEVDGSIPFTSTTLRSRSVVSSEAQRAQEDEAAARLECEIPIGKVQRYRLMSRFDL